MEVLSEINELANLTKSLCLAMNKLPNDVNKINDNVVLSNIICDRMQKLRDEIYEE